jgi:nucleotide-binding universal stress UspA family protein
MAHVSHKLSNSFEGALAGGGDPATSPLYVFGPFLRLIVVAGVAGVTFGASIWLVVLTVATVSAMYRLVMAWVLDGSGGSGLSEEEFGSWAVKINAGITFVEYTLTFLVSMAALVTFIADRYPALDQSLFGLEYRTVAAILLSILTGWLVNRGPKTAARTFGPATLAVLILLWAMVICTVWRLGFHLPDLNLRAFSPHYVHFTLSGYAHILALMTGIEVFANLVAAYQGDGRQKSRKAFGSLLIIMGTTCVTMLIVGPAVLQLSDPTNARVSVFTQTMDRLLPEPLPYLGTLVGVIVLGSAAAASAQGLQNLALGLRYRNYVPAPIGQRNRFDVADKPVWIEVGIVAVCYLAFGTKEGTYLAIYAAGVFVLLSMTGWAAVKRLARELRAGFSGGHVAALSGAVVAAALTSGATVIIFVERFSEGVWTYLLFLPVLYGAFTYFRWRLGAPVPLDDHLGRIFVGQYLLPFERQARRADETVFEDIVVPLDGSILAEQSLPVAELLCQSYDCRLTLIAVERSPAARETAEADGNDAFTTYLRQVADPIQQAGLKVDFTIGHGSEAAVINTLAHDVGADLIVMTTHGRSGVERWFVGDVANRILRLSSTPILMLRPTDDWRSRRTQFKRLLVSLDGSVGSENILRYARAVARRFESEIVLLSVPEADSEETKIRHYLESVAEALQKRGLQVRALVTGSGPARTIIAVSESENADVIMMATRGRGGTATNVAIGSVAERVVQVTQCPVFLVPIRNGSRHLQAPGPRLV